MTLVHVGIAVFAAFFLATLTVFLIARDRLSYRNRRLRERMRRMAEGAAEVGESGYVILRDESFSQIPFLDKILSRSKKVARLQQMIDQAGLPLKSGALILGMLSLTGLVWLLASTVLKMPFVDVIVALLAGSLPLLWVMRKRRQRIDRFEELLPEGIDLVINALRSGFSLESSLSLVAQEIPDPLGAEFAITFEEQNLGLDLVQALDNMNRRMPSEDLKIMTTAIAIQKKSGGNLAEVLGKISALIRERFHLRREIRTLTAQGRLSGMILVLMPLVMAVILSILSPGYIKILTQDPVGQYMIAIAVILEVIGILVIRRIVNLKF